MFALKSLFFVPLHVGNASDAPALVVARAATRTRTQGKTTFFPQGEGCVSIEIEYNFNANLV